MAPILVNARHGVNSNTLQAASIQGHDRTVGLLLKRSADVNAEGGMCGSALQAASVNDHERTVKLLLFNGAILIDGSHFDPLQRASSRGHTGIVKLLLENGANVYAELEKCQSERRAAEARNNANEVERLVEKEALLCRHRSQFHAGARMAWASQFVQVVNLLLEGCPKAELKTENQMYERMLHVALEGGYERTL